MKITKRIKGETVAELTLTKLWSNEWEIEYLKVEPSHRGKGLASELLERAKAHAIKNQLLLIGYLEPIGSLDREQMKSWLVRHGFKHSWYDFTNSFHKGSQKRVLIFNGSGT